MRRLRLLCLPVLLLASCGGAPTGGTAPVPLERASDLVMISVSFDPAVPRPGESVTAAVQWADLAGDDPFPVSITLDLVLQPDALGRVCSWKTSEAAGTVTCELPGWDEPGAFAWDAWVDTLRVVEEPNEGNNTLTGTITVEE